jgi:hypothetical protein
MHLEDCLLSRRPPGRFALYPERDVACHLVKPAFPISHGSSLARQDQESGLSRILGVVDVRQHPAADTQHHGSMALHKRSESRIVAGGGKTMDQLVIG